MLRWSSPQNRSRTDRVSVSKIHLSLAGRMELNARELHTRRAIPLFSNRDVQFCLRQRSSRKKIN